jgi:thiol-disulfide isomerase/thioredoxin
MDKKRKSQIILGLVLVLIVGVITYIESGKVKSEGDAGNQDITINKSSEERVATKRAEYDVAKEISTPDGFINIDSIGVEELVGKKIILIDFWTYSCINCQRTLPYLNDWHEKYSDDGLVILGIHTPEFEFEKDIENVSRAVEKWDVKYPVILDNDFSTWRSYKNRYWPRKYLIDIDGFIVYDHIGEGGYEETESKIVELLNEKNQILGMKEVQFKDGGPENIDVVDFSKVRTHETYLGSSRVEYLANLPNVTCAGKDCDYESGGSPKLNSFELDGTWNMQPEHSKLVSDGGSIFIRFNANKVNIVAQSDKGVSAEIYLDGELVSEGGGYSVEGGVAQFKDSDLYNLIDLEGDYSEHLLEIRFFDRGVEAFAFTFG